MQYSISVNVDGVVFADEREARLLGWLTGGVRATAAYDGLALVGTWTFDNWVWIIAATSSLSARICWLNISVIFSLCLIYICFCSSICLACSCFCSSNDLINVVTISIHVFASELLFACLSLIPFPCT